MNQPRKLEDIREVLIMGSGPIIIGRACEFDYSGTQACKALRTAGYEIVLVNSNPATTTAAARAAVEGIEADLSSKGDIGVKPLLAYHAEIR